jgi:hypothetical protein
MPFGVRLLRLGLYAFAITFGIVAGLGTGWLFLIWLLFRGTGGGVD